MAQLFANNVSTKLDTSIQSTDTSMTVWSSAGMPTLGVGDYFLLTLVGLTDGSETAWEIVKVTAVVGNELTVVRAQEGTTAQFWAGGTKVEVRLTAGSVPVIDDAVTSTTKTWSSSKVSTELSGKAATSHTHANATTSTAGFMSSADKTKLDGVATGANNYTHPTGDGNLHVPATGTTNSGKVLTAGATAGSLSWTAIPAAPVSSVAGKTGAVTLVKGDVGLGNVDNTSDANKPVSTATQTALNAKQNTITGAATTITSSNLTASMAMVTDASGKVAAHGTVSATELGYLDGVTSAIQAQLNGKAASSHNHDASNITTGTLPVTRGGTGAITLTGILKGNGTGAFTAATAETDYVTPSGTGTLTNKTLTGLRETSVAIAASDINLSLGNLFTKTLTGAITFSVSNVSASGTVSSFILELTNAGAYTITWWANVKWAGGTAPTLTASGVDILGFYTNNGGTTWRGMVMAKDSK